jgi:putative endonuclease
MPPRPGFWWVYILERADGSWYTGISTDPHRRLQQHIAGKGARANKVSAPQRLLSLEAGGDYAKALRREAQVKKLNKPQKRAYAADPTSLPWPDEKAPWYNAKKRPKRKPGAKKPRILVKKKKAQGKAVKV